MVLGRRKRIISRAEPWRKSQPRVVLSRQRALPPGAGSARRLSRPSDPERQRRQSKPHPLTQPLEPLVHSPRVPAVRMTLRARDKRRREIRIVLQQIETRVSRDQNWLAELI